MITHAASRKQYTVLLDRPLGTLLFLKSISVLCLINVIKMVYHSLFIMQIHISGIMKKIFWKIERILWDTSELANFRFDGLRPLLMLHERKVSHAHFWGRFRSTKGCSGTKLSFGVNTLLR